MKGPKGIVKAHMPKTYRQTPKRPALHVGYRSCGFMQQMRQKGVTTIGIDPFLFDGVDQFGRTSHELHPVCKEYYDTQQLSQRVLSNVKSFGDATLYSVAVVTHVLERKPLQLLDKTIQSLHNVAPHLVIVIGAFDDEQDTSEYPQDLVS